MQAVVDGLLTNYQKTGHGKTVLLLHGWGDSSKTFASLAKELAEKYEVLSLDLPGFGGTQIASSAWGLSEYVNFVDSWLKKIKAPELYALIGHSNGGAIAIFGISAQVFQSKKLILIASSGIRGEYKSKRQLRKLIVKFGKVLSAPLPITAKQKLKRKVYNATGSEALLYPELEDSFKKIVSQDIRQDAAKIKQPTLLIYGSGDEATPVRYGQMLTKAIANSSLEIIEGSGHFVHQDSGETVNKLVSNFLDK